MRKLYFTVVLILCTFLTYGQTTQWIGPAGGNWTTAANWTNGVPAAGNDALITAGSDIAINNPIIIDFAVTNFTGDIAVNADVFNIGNFVNSGGSMSLDNGALFLNSGSVTFTNDGPFSNDGSFLNYGTFQQNGNGVFNNNSTGVFINFGNITNVGNFINDGMVENFGSLTNASTYVNNALTTNCGQFINTFVSTLDNNAGATFHNKPGAQLFIDRDFNNAGTLNDDGSTTVNASGVVNNTNTININGLFQLSTIFNNNGTVNVVGSYTSNFGTTNNEGNWNNTGSTTNLGTFNNNAGGNLANSSTLMNGSCASFFQRSNNTVNGMTNDGVLFELGGTVNLNGASQGASVNDPNSLPIPELICRDIQIQTDANGEVFITTGDVLTDGNARYCNIVTLDISETEFTCADLGPNPVTLTLTDGFGTSNTCNVTVTVVESSPNPCNTSFLNYCNATSTQLTPEYIQSVSLADLVNTSGNSLATDFTNMVATLDFGNFFDLEVIAGGSNSGSVSIGVWIDWNNDGDFDDAGEDVLNSVDGPTTANAVVNVPGSALPGTTRMRVGLRRVGTIGPCETVTFGEYEDYTIMINSDITIQRCVADIVVSAPAGATEQVVGWIPPRGFSTCQNGVDIELIAGLPNGSAFPLGTTVNTFSFVDGCGGSETCDFTVTVNPTPVTFSLSCPDDVILQGSAGLGGAIANWIPPFPTATCPNGVNLPVQTIGPAQGEFLPIGTRVTVCFEASDNCGNTDNCCLEVFVTDPAESLEFDNCPSLISVDAAAGASGAVVNYPNLTATSSCAAGGLNIILQDGLPSGSTFPIGNTTVTHRAVDNCNSATLCSFMVTVNPVPSMVTLDCPEDIIVDVNPGSPSQVINYPAVTASSNCPGQVNLTQTQGLPSGSTFPLGNTVVQFMANDNCGSMESCNFNVTLNTVFATTTITCPADITVNAEPGAVGAVVNFTEPTANSDCFAGGLDVTLISALASGDQFPLGTQEVIYFANDDCGSADGCSFFVTVEPTQADLVLTCRNNITRNRDVGDADPVVGFAAPTATTTCGGNVNITQIAGPASGSSFAPGRTTITYRGTDNCGNVEICSFDIIVNIATPADDDEITVNCVDDITITATPGQTTASVGFDLPTGTTSCNTGGTGVAPSICATRTVTNVHQCNGIDKVMWLNFDGLENNYRSSNSTFTEFTDGTAIYSGTIINIANSNIRFQVEAFFSGRTTTTPAGSPNIGSCISPNTSNFYYYTNVTGTLTGTNNAQGAFIKLSRVAEAFQVGPGAHVTGDNLSLGASGWLQLNIVTQPSGSLNLVLASTGLNDADFNFLISGNVGTCRDNGTDCSQATNTIDRYTFLGQFQGSKYFMSNTITNIATARNIAAANGGHVATIGSQEENDFITSAINQSAYIGFNDEASEGNFVWGNGEPITYTNWNNNEPNNSNNEDITQIRINGKWNDIKVTTLQRAIIEVGCPPTCDNQSESIAGYTYVGEFEDSKYFVANSATSWVIAQRNAVAAGGNLASISSLAENNFIRNNGNPSSGSYWLGFQNVNNTPTFQWVNGDPVTYTNWNTNEPNETTQQVYARMIDASGGWTDRQNSLNFNGILEIECGSGSGSGSSDVTVTQVHGLAPNTNFPVGTTTVIYELTDDCGNTAFCEFDVTVNQPNSAIALNNCPTDITVTAPAGATAMTVNFNAPTATSDCTQGNVVLSQIGGFASGDAFPVGQTTVSYRAVDGCGNEQFCSFFVNVEATPPAATEITVNCPDNITVNAAAGANSSSVSFTTPTATTTCNSNVNITQIGGLPSGSDFPIGTTVIFYRLADECGNVESCAFNVAVFATPSEITIDCPNNVSVNTAPDAEFATATFGNATASSNCFTGSESITQIGGLPSGSLFPVGNNVIFFKASDACGNFAVCNFLVTVNATPITNIDVCINSGGDADGDGVCANIDCDDNNPLVSGAGDSCNDGNPATSNDVIQADCSCAGVIVFDCPALSANFGDACNDGNANTNNDVIQADCSCAGTIIPPTFDCPALSANIGDACNDGNANTNNDTVQADCSCAGTPAGPTFDCPALGANIGDACNDGDATTNNDSVQADCTCAGTPASTGCDVVFTVNGLDITVQNLTAPITTLQIFDAGFAPLFGCNNFGGTPCDPTETITLPSEGTYFISVQTMDSFGSPMLCDFFETINATNGGGGTPTFDCPALSANIGDACNDGNASTNNDVVQADCSCAGTPTNPTFDCPALSANIGDACNDGDATTNNDSVQADCTCAGTPASTGCDVTFSVDGLTLTIQNLNAPITTAKVFDAGFGQVFGCDNFGGTVCNATETITLPAAGTYFVSVQTFNDFASPALCDFFETIEVTAGGGGTPTFDCPALSANIGDACNDGDASTTNDVVQADCSCAGTPDNTSPWDCEAISANFGDACNDGNPNTSNDQIQTDCSCAGTPAQTGCTATYSVNGLDVDFQNTNAPISTVKVFDNTFAPVFGCDNFGGTACANNFTVNLPSAGTYFVQIQTYQDWATPLCNVFDEITVSGTGGGTPPPPTTCDNVTNGGTISGDQTICSTDSPAGITSAAFPSGGSGTMEYIWLSSTSTCPNSLNDQIAGANQSAYQPGTLSQTTYFRRLSRRAGCTDWFQGESNCVEIEVESCNNNGGNPPANGCSATYSVSGMDITLSNIANNIAASAVFNNAFVPVFQCNNFGGTACNNVEVITVPSPGTYFVQIQTYSDWSNQLCNIFEEVTVTGNAPRIGNNNGTQNSNSEGFEVTTEKSIADFKVFPNPASDNVKVQLNDYLGQNVQIRLFNQLGVNVKNISLTEVEFDTHQIDLSSIHNGIYTLTIFADGQKPVSKKLVVRRN